MHEYGLLRPTTVSATSKEEMCSFLLFNKFFLTAMLRITFPHGEEIQKMYVPVKKAFIEDGRSTQEFNPPRLHTRLRINERK